MKMGASTIEGFDYLVAGTGVAGLSAAIAARRQGLKTLIVESTDRWGGATAISGGGLWLPNNPLMVNSGTDDSVDEALNYMVHTIGDIDAVVERRRTSASLRFDPVIVRLLTEHEPLRQFIRRLDRVLIADAGYEAHMPTAILTSVLGVAALHPLVADMDDETFRRQMLKVARRIFDLPDRDR
jgi:predicted oxidoreductase